MTDVSLRIRWPENRPDKNFAFPPGTYTLKGETDNKHHLLYRGLSQLPYLGDIPVNL